MKDILFALPPVIEQREIADGVAAATGATAAAGQRALAEIHLLREYRTRLIADVVTGKLDVRDAAARLPDEAEPGDDAEERVEDEASDEEIAEEAPA